MTDLGYNMVMVRNGEWDNFCEKYVWSDNEEMSENEKQLYDRDYNTGLTPINYFQTPPKSDQNWVYFFKFVDALIVGCVIIAEVTDWDNSICLANVAVDERYQRKGYAKELLNCMFEYMQNNYQSRTILTIYHPYTEDILKPVIEYMTKQRSIKIRSIM